MFDFIELQVIEYGIFAAFMLMLINGIISSPPSELVLALVGVVLVETYSGLFAMAGVIAIGNLIGGYILYEIGKKYGVAALIWFRELLNKSRYSLLRFSAKVIPDKRKLFKYKQLFSINGGKWVFVFRCMPVVRSIISLPAGAAKMPRVKFLVCSYIGMTLWAIIWIGFGFALKSTWVNYQMHMSAPFIAALIFITFYLGTKLKKISNSIVQADENAPNK